ncbi:hypothetical protein ASF76_08155 [Microbacterium sp. Leaf151]|nr:hypothetical protein ASF76_08155 [Microbacterium sp. Leaf151]
MVLQTCCAGVALAGLMGSRTAPVGSFAVSFFFSGQSSVGEGPAAGHHIVMLPFGFVSFRRIS